MTSQTKKQARQAISAVLHEHIGQDPITISTLLEKVTPQITKEERNEILNDIWHNGEFTW